MASIPSFLSPIIIKAGKRSRRAIKNLIRGRGRLAADVDDVIADTLGELGDDIQGKDVVPVVIIYRKRPAPKKRRGLLGIPFNL